MSAMVVLALTLALFATGMVAVAVLLLLRAAKDLRTAVAGSVERLTPLADELRAESAVTSTEVEALQARLGEGRARRR
jgi:hypothetical protein